MRVNCLAQEQNLIPVPLRNERRRGSAGKQRDKAPVESPGREGRDPTEGSVLGPTQ